MSRKKTNAKDVSVQSWAGKHHRYYLSPKDENEVVQWATENASQLDDLFFQCFEDGWSIKISPDKRSQGFYATIQDKNENAEFGDHSIGISWGSLRGAVAVATYAIHVLSENGALWRDIAINTRDILDFLR